MNITTLANRRSARASLTMAMATAVVLSVAACGTEHATSQAPASIKQAVPSGDADLPPDVEQCLVEQAKVPGATLRCWELAQSDGDEPSMLAPSGRPVPLPGGNG